MKVREVIDRVIGGTGLTPLPWEQTCDRLIAGSMDQEVTRIGSTFMANTGMRRPGCCTAGRRKPGWT